MQTVFQYQKEGNLPEFDRVVLLSTSPRRRELLSFLTPEIQSVAVDERLIEETYMAHFSGDDFVTRAAKTCCEISKAKSDLPLEVGKLYISADTIILSDDKIVNKPRDLEEAKAMLRSYFGKSHYVVTSVCLRMCGYLDVFYTMAKIDFVAFYEALDQAIEEYVDQKKPLDKSGAYGIQELDPRFIQTIHGDLYTIVGLPVSELSTRLFSQTAVHEMVE